MQVGQPAATVGAEGRFTGLWAFKTNLAQASVSEVAVARESRNRPAP